MNNPLIAELVKGLLPVAIFFIIAIIIIKIIKK